MRACIIISLASHLSDCMHSLELDNDLSDVVTSEQVKEGLWGGLEAVVDVLLGLESAALDELWYNASELILEGLALVVWVAAWLALEVEDDESLQRQSLRDDLEGVLDAVWVWVVVL